MPGPLRKRRVVNPISNTRVVVFDAYGTLIDTGDGSLRAAAAILQKNDCPLDPAEFYAAWKEYHRLHIDSLATFRLEKDIFLLDLVSLYEDYGIPGKPEDDVCIMLATLGVRQAFAETRQVLDALRATHGLYVASTSDHEPLMLDIERNGINVNGVFTSESLRLYKPRAEFYESILAALNLGPEEAVFVGDSVIDDVAGPRAVGLRTIWVNRKGARLGHGDPAPDYEVPDLRGLI